MSDEDIQQLKSNNVCLYCGTKVPILTTNGFCLLCAAKMEADYEEK